MRGDLHCHSRLSDSSAGIEEIIGNAKQVGLQYVSITDHDCLDSFSRAKVIGEQYGVQIVEGVELSSYDTKRNRKVHVLCYLPQKPDRLLGICNRTIEQRKKSGIEMAKSVMRKFPIVAERITKYSSSSKCIYKQHIMHALMDAGYTLSIYGQLYDRLFYDVETSCNIPIEYPDVYEVIETIHSAGGIAVLAHPRVYDSFDLLNELIEKNMLDGIEVWHPMNLEGDSELLINLAINNDLIPTGGSDFHGMYNSIETNVGKCYTPQKYLDKLFIVQK